MWWIKVSFLHLLQISSQHSDQVPFVDVIFIFIIRQEHTAQFCSLDESVLIAESQKADFRQSKLTDFFFYRYLFFASFCNSIHLEDIKHVLYYKQFLKQCFHLSHASSSIVCV